MLLGFLLIFFAGLCWVGVGISVSFCSARSWNYNLVQGLSYLGATLICAALVTGKGLLSGSWDVPGWGILMSFAAGIANFYTFVLTAEAMKRGPNGLVWGIMQSGMIGSFLMGLIFFGEKAAPLRFLGLALILSGVLIMGLNKGEKSSPGSKSWIYYSLGAFLLVIATQCFNTLPSYFPESTEESAVGYGSGLTFPANSGNIAASIPRISGNSTGDPFPAPMEADHCFLH